MAIQATSIFSNAAIKPFFDDANYNRTAVRLAPNKTFTRGQILALVAVTSAVQSITGTTGYTGGQYQINVFGMASDVLAHNAVAATIRTALAAIPAIGSIANVAVSGGPLNTVTPIVITFQGALANTPVPLVTISSVASNPLTGAAVSAAVIAHTTIGISAMTYDSYSSAVVAVPSTAIVPSAIAGGTVPDGTYRIWYTGRNAQGETTVSAQVGAVTLSGGSNTVRIAAMTGLPSGFTNLDVYIGPNLGTGAPTFLGTIAVTGTTTAQTDFTAPAAVASFKYPPLVNTAYSSSANVAIMILEYDARTDSDGYVIIGQNAAVTMEHGEQQETVSAFYSGTFSLADLVGFDAKARTDIGGRIIAGAIGGTGVLTF
jgi:hypothetical protein